LGVTLPLTNTQEQVTYFATPSLREFHPDRFPAWIWYDNPCFYGVPVYGEERGVKVAQDIGGREVTLQSRTFDEDKKTTARVGAFMRRHLPLALGPAVATKTCMYTLTPDRNFVIDTLPSHPQISLGLGAGHAFKFASIIGRVLSDLAIDGSTNYNVGEFAVDRPILTMQNPPRAFEDYLAKNLLPVAD
ncbi:MAG: Sarcosine oxidase, partial [Chloroflexi bacterium]|nr:Sarcosine oxidase [Chloroflexota bacterium]